MRPCPKAVQVAVPSGIVFKIGETLRSKCISHSVLAMRRLSAVAMVALRLSRSDSPPRERSRCLAPLHGRRCSKRVQSRNARQSRQR